MSTDHMRERKQMQQASGSSKQSGTRTFFRGIREVGKFAVKHPILTTLSALTLVGAISTDKATAQEKETKKDEIGLMAGNVGKKEVPKDELKVELKNGIFDFGDKAVDAKEDLKQIIGKEDLSENAVVKKIMTHLEGVGLGFYYVFDHGIIGVFEQEGPKPFRVVGAGADDKVFTDDGSMFVAQDGSIVGTTPTTLLIITPTDESNPSYQKMYGSIPPFKKPKISQGGAPDIVFIRDETMNNGKMRVRLELNLRTLEIKVAEDKPSIGSLSR